MQTDATRAPFWIPNETIPIQDLSNQEFLERFARAGRIGLSTGTSFCDNVIARAQRHLNPNKQWGIWTHAFVFEGTRVDGMHWVVESDLAFHDKHIQLGAQENRIDRYYDEKRYRSLAVLDFGLSQDQSLKLIRECLDLVARRTRYSLRELLGILAAMKNPALRGQQNILAQDESFFCSAFVAHLFRKVGMDIVPGLTVKHTAPDDLARSAAPHSTYLLQRDVPVDKLSIGRRRVAAKVVEKVAQVGRAVSLKSAAKKSNAPAP